MKDNNAKKTGRFWVIPVCFLLLILAMTLVIWRYYAELIDSSGSRENLSGREFARHYVMIADNSTSSIWKDIYQNAVETGRRKDAYVEMLGNWFSDEYTAVDYMEIAIAAKVDGIIVKPDGSAAMRKAINRAEHAGIPVVTVLQDESQTERTSFVGVNSYQLGTAYGEQVCRCITEDTRSVLVLLNEKEAGKELVFKQLKATVQQSGLAKDISITATSITTKNAFDPEEVIHDIFQDEANRPDILVCMNDADSERAYQALIEFNCVGDVEIIGYYQTDTMLSAISKGTVPAAIFLDSGQIGVYCVEALEEYAEMGYVSNYFSVDPNIVTRENVGRFLQEES